MLYKLKNRGYPGNNCRHCWHGPKKGKRNNGFPKQRRKNNKYSEEELIKLLRDYCESRYGETIMKEVIAAELNIQEHEVAQALSVLYREGLVSRPKHGAPHDSKREKYGYGNDSSWCGSTYTIREFGPRYEPYINRFGKKNA